MKRLSNRSLILIFALLLLVSLAWIAAIKIMPQNSLIAEIHSDGKIIYTIDLNKVTNSYNIELPHNTVLVEHGKISMLSADCPDQLCVKQGKISDGSFPIVCLPNKIMIRIAGKSGVDAVAGR